MKKVVTINRQFGSGGREVGKRLADALNIAYYDHELINKIAEETNMHPDYIADCQELSVSRTYAISVGRTFSMPQLSPTDNIQIAQTKIIKKLGTEQDCVIVGRCANNILEETAFKVFIFSSDINARIQRCYDKVPEDKNKSEKEMQKSILAVDKKRAKYHSYYTGQEWLEISNYNLCIDTAKIDIKTAVELIAAAVNKSSK